eukprot:353412-Chlamydomonas_euryale.AAC.3
MLAEEAAAAAALSFSDDVLHPRQVDTHAGPATTSARYADANMLAEEAAAFSPPVAVAQLPRQADTRSGSAAILARYADASMLAEDAAAAAASPPAAVALQPRQADAQAVSLAMSAMHADASVLAVEQGANTCTSVCTHSRQSNLGALLVEEAAHTVSRQASLRTADSAASAHAEPGTVDLAGVQHAALAAAWASSDMFCLFGSKP